ncbi:uncharacterized protein LOC141587354 [Silene latifolia]|uniref:uncharacterized protein LOC141587354 n=1 Tax=Silene latifolia TaxID=37657 RepID=UPI003D771D34
MHFRRCNNNSDDNKKTKLLVALEGLGLYNNVGCSLTVRKAETLQKTCRIFKRHDSYSYRIIGSCNGLLLVSRNDGPPCYREELRLWNPCIRKSLVIPACPFSTSLFTNSVYLFGFAPVSKDYKVVAFTFEKSPDVEPRKMFFAVYTLGDQQWTVRNNQFDIILPNTTGTFGPFHSVSTAVSFRGAAYWLGQIDNQNQDNRLTHLGSFDFESENITFLKLPFSLEETQYLRFLFLLRDSLAIFSISEVNSSIWVLEQANVNRPWSLWFTGKSSWYGYKAFTNCICKHRKVFYCESDGGYFVCGEEAYNIASCEMQELQRYMRFDGQLETYSESLVLSAGYGARDLKFFP